LSDEQIAGLRRDLYLSVRRSCPAWLAAQVEDIVQTALMRVLAVHKKGGGNPRFGASYLKRAAYSATVDEMRKHFRRGERQEGEAEMERTPSATVDPERRSAALDIHHGIRDCMAAMLQPRRLAVACHLMGYSVPEAARFLGWTPKRTEHLVRRGLQDLRGCLSTKGIEP
jgi:RNA polymerase sigma-70 factor (ECF subfamily)